MITDTQQLADLYQVSGYIAKHPHLARIGDTLTTLGAGTIHVLQVLAVIASLVLIGIAVMVAKKLHMLGAPTVAVPPDTTVTGSLPTPAPVGPLAERWKSILHAMESNVDNDWKFAIMEADKLVDLALKERGFPGESLGERLMNIQVGDLASLDGIWEAHKLRNRIAHDVGHLLRHGEAKRAIGLFEAALHELEMI